MIFGLTIIKKRLMKLLILCHDILNRMFKKSYFLSKKYEDLLLTIIVICKSIEIDNKNLSPLS